MKKYYIKTINSNIFIKDVIDSEIILTSEFNKILEFNNLGDAMKTAAQTNEILGSTIFKVEYYYDTTVPNKLVIFSNLQQEE